MEDVKPDKTVVVAPVKEEYPLSERITVTNLAGLSQALSD